MKSLYKELRHLIPFNNIIYTHIRNNIPPEGLDDFTVAINIIKSLDAENKSLREQLVEKIENTSVVGGFKL